MWTVALRAACLAAAAFTPMACSRFGIDAIVPDTETDSATPGDDDGGDGGGSDGGENCTTFSASFGAGELGANGFGEPQGDIKVVDGALVSSVSTSGSNASGSYASHDVEVPIGTKLDFVEVDYTMTLSALPEEGAMTFGCMLYAKVSRDRSQDNNQVFLQFDDEVKVTLASKTENAPKGDSSRTLFTRETMPLRKPIKARLRLAVVDDRTTAKAELDAKTASPEDVPLAGGDLRVVTIQCGIPTAQTAIGSIVADVKIDDLSARICVKR